MAKLSEKNGQQFIYFDGEFDIIFSEAVYTADENDLTLVGIVTELFAEDLYNNSKEKVSIPTTPVIIKVPRKNQTVTYKKQDGSEASFEKKCPGGMATGIKLLMDAIEPNQPFKGLVSFKIPMAVQTALETGKDKFGRDLTPERIAERVEELFSVEKIDSLSFKVPETGFKKGYGAAKQSEKQRLEDRFQFLVEKLPSETPADNLYSLYFRMLEDDSIKAPTFNEFLAILMS